MAIVRETKTAMELPPQREDDEELLADDPAIGSECAVCDVAFVEGDVVTQLLAGPGASVEQQVRAASHLQYEAVWLLAHQTCVRG